MRILEQLLSEFAVNGVAVRNSEGSVHVSSANFVFDAPSVSEAVLQTESLLLG